MQTSSETVDVEALMLRIREEVAQTLSQEGGRWTAGARPQNDALDRKGFTPIICAEELSFLNNNWHSLMVQETPSSHRKFFGKFVVRAKRFIIDTVWHYLFHRYLEREKELLMNLVRYLNANARHIDAQDYDGFWQLVKKVDNDVAALNERMDQLFDSAAVDNAQLRRELASLRAERSERDAV